MKAAPDHAYVYEALMSAEIAALSLTKVELCHFLVELRRILGTEGPVRFLRSCFGLEERSLPELRIDHAGGKPALQYMPLVDAIGEPSLKDLPSYGGWKWWALYVRWKLFVGDSRLGEEDKRRYRSIIGNREVLEDAGIEDSDILVGTYRFQVDFDPDEEWIDEKALCLLCDVSEKTVAEFCSKNEAETCKADYLRTVIRVGAVREYLSTAPAFVPTTFLNPDDDRIKAAAGEK